MYIGVRERILTRCAIPSCNLLEGLPNFGRRLVALAGALEQRHNHIRCHDVRIESQSEHVLQGELPVAAEHLEQTLAARSERLLSRIRAWLRMQIIRRGIKRLEP